jgi:hypothetical protein
MPGISVNDFIQSTAQDSAANATFERENPYLNVDRPPVRHEITGQELYPGQALPHFNEADEGCGVDALVINRIWKAMDLDPATTLHDIRWGEHYTGAGIDDFVWVFLISGAVPASHFAGGYAGASCSRQPPCSSPWEVGR